MPILGSSSYLTGPRFFRIPKLIGISCCLNSSEFKSTTGKYFLFAKSINKQPLSYPFIGVILISGQQAVTVGV